MFGRSQTACRQFLLLMPIAFLAGFLWTRLRGWKQAVLLGFAVFLAEWKAAKLVKRRRQHTHTSAA